MLCQQLENRRVERGVRIVTCGIGIEIIRAQTECLVVIRPTRFEVQGLHISRVTGNTELYALNQSRVGGVVNIMTGIVQRSRTRQVEVRIALDNLQLIGTETAENDIRIYLLIGLAQVGLGVDGELQIRIFNGCCGFRYQVMQLRVETNIRIGVLAEGEFVNHYVRLAERS